VSHWVASNPGPAAASIAIAGAIAGEGQPSTAWPLASRPRCPDAVTGIRTSISTAADTGLGANVALFCHFDPAGTVRPDIPRYLNELRAAGFSVVTVSNSGHLMPEAKAALQAVCAAILVRRNSGRDFAAWREALERLQLPRPATTRLLLVNDSVLGPLAPLAPLLSRMDDTADVWGMTDSDELAWHLQSYFLLVNRPVLDSPGWRRFWRGVRPMPSKLLIVMRYEIGLSRCLVRAGFRLKALFPHRSVGVPDGKNPTLAAWQALRADGFPFVKRQAVGSPQHEGGGGIQRKIP
jgi:lipopolysaccharide biosynthesis protein